MALLLQGEQNTTEYAWAFGTGWVMGLNINTVLSGADEVIQRLNDLQTVFIPREQENAIEEILDESAAQLQEYPPETDANQPPPPYYIRGVGQIGRGGQLTSGKESQLLDANWQIEMTSSADGVTGILRNVASYSGYVHDASPEAPQMPWHRDTGWPIAVDVVRGVLAGQDEVTEVSSEAVETQGPFSRLLQNVADFFNR
jgi:hypothetical protein